MMYTFGNTKEFAISYELDVNSCGSWLFGKFCYWIGGEIVGDYDVGTSLRDVLLLLRSIVIDNGNRENVNLFGLSHEELYMRLDSTLYGGGERSDYEELAEEECWARFKIFPSVDIFDDWKIYLIDSPPKARIVYSFRSKNVVEFNLSSGIFDQVATSIFDTLSNIHESEVENVN
jgi:Immunity protein 42